MLGLGLGLRGLSRIEGGGYPAGTIYVSKTATNGFAIGSDSNTLAQAQDRATPFATIAKAMSSVSNGGYVVVNDGDYTTTELGSGSVLLVNGGTVRMATIRAHNRGLVRFIGTNATYVVRLDSIASAGLALTLDGINIDANSVSSYCVGDTDLSGNLHTVNLLNCTFTNPTLRAVSAGGPTKYIYNILNPTHTAGASRSFFYSNTASSGCSVAISGGSSTITQQNNTQGVIEYRATEAGAAFSCTGFTLASTLLSSLTGNGTHDGIALYNISSVSVVGNSISVAGAYGTRIGAAVRATANAAVDVTATITGNTIFNGTTGGYGILIGSDGTSSGDMRCNDPIVVGNTISGTPASQVTPVHGILLGFQKGGSVMRNTVSGCGLAMIQKKNTVTGALFAANTIRLSAFATVGYSIAMYAKGAVGTRFVNNSVYVNDASANNAFIQHVQQDDVSLTNSSGVEFTNNAIYFTGAAAVKFTNVAASNVATFSHNLYYSPSALPASCFNYQGASYSSVATWAAAQEASAVATDPKFTDAANDNFVLLAGSGCIGAGVTASGATTDKAGVTFASPPSIGAYEYAA